METKKVVTPHPGEKKLALLRLDLELPLQGCEEISVVPAVLEVT